MKQIQTFNLDIETIKYIKQYQIENSNFNRSATLTQMLNEHKNTRKDIRLIQKDNEILLEEINKLNLENKALREQNQQLWNKGQKK